MGATGGASAASAGSQASAASSDSAASAANDAAVGVGADIGLIRVAAALIVDDSGRILLVRKRDTTVFMQPGGKYEPGESGAQTLARELYEELGLAFSTDALDPLGTFTAPAANEAGMLVEAEVFRAALSESTGAPSAGAEIEEVRWLHPDEFDALAVAPLVTVHMLALMR